MSTQRATIVLVHGAWHGSWCWEELLPLLEERALTVRTVDLPSVGADPESGADLSGDAAAVRALLDQIDGPILLLGHSYGGMVITQAAAGHAGVQRLVYLCAFMPDEGESLLELTGGEPAPWIRLLDDGLTLPDLEQAPAVFYGDCDPATASRATAAIRPMSAAPFVEPVSEPAWRSIPATYVVCAQDGALPPELQRDVFAPRAAEVVELDRSHSPFLSAPEELAELLEERAGAPTATS
jgi:pimeloyl-ACP methyl ester carboxylesterase